MDVQDISPAPIAIVAAAMILAGAVGLAGGLSREGTFVVVMVLLAVVAFLAGRRSADLW